jgi:hypothetical protein
MQFDPDRTFCEIHEDSKALCDSIQEIIDVALVETSDTCPLNLRFVTPRDHSDDWYLNDTCADYELTPPGYQADYIAVSYCWRHAQSTDGLPPMPAYQVFDGVKEGLPPRLVRCPEIVFHLAFVFARKHQIRHVTYESTRNA